MKCVFFILFFCLPLTGKDLFAQQEIPAMGFWAVKGNLLKHPFPDNIDTLSGQLIYELLDEQGFSLWFSRYIFKDVCMTGQCKMIRLWVFWDGAGNYLGIQLLENEPLTKSDHTEFETADYMKLDAILQDSSSVLGKMKSEELEVKIEVENPNEVDGYSSATQPALSEIVVKDAVFTCHTLWHTVYGPTNHGIKDILNQRADNDYLDLMFKSENHLYISWAIGFIKNNPAYHPDFFEKIISMIGSGDYQLSQIALQYFKYQGCDDVNVQLKLAGVLPEIDPRLRSEIIWIFLDNKNIDIDVVVVLLELFEKRVLGVGALNLIFRLVKPEFISDNRIASILNRLSTDDNAYIRNMSLKLLDGSLK